MTNSFRIQDQLNRSIHFKESPKRIVSLVPSQTELLCDLGLEHLLVGVTKFCIHPHHIKTDVEVVGGTKHIHLDKIKALRPDIILCNKEENTQDIVHACAAICNVHVSDIFTIQDSLELIAQYGQLFNKAKESSIIIEKVDGEIKDFKIFLENQSVLKVVYFIWKNPWMVAANNTFINHLLELNKFENVYGSEERYPEIALDKIDINNEVNLVLLSSEPFPFKESHKNELQTYFPNAKVVLVDGEMFSWYGSRLLKAFGYFRSLRLNLQRNQSY